MFPQNFRRKRGILSCLTENDALVFSQQAQQAVRPGQKKPASAPRSYPAPAGYPCSAVGRIPRCRNLAGPTDRDHPTGRRGWHGIIAAAQT